jgi:hypothetical protein
MTGKRRAATVNRLERIAEVEPVLRYLEERLVMQLWLAARLGMHKQDLHQMSLGQRPVPADFRARCIEILGQTPEERERIAAEIDRIAVDLVRDLSERKAG